MLEAGHPALFDSAMRSVGLERMQTCGLPDESALFADPVVDTRTSLEVRRQRRKDETSRRERTVCKEGESAFDTAKADVRLEPQHLEEDKHVLRSSTRAREREALSLLQLFQRGSFSFPLSFAAWRMCFGTWHRGFRPLLSFKRPGSRALPCRTLLGALLRHQPLFGRGLAAPPVATAIAKTSF